MLQLDELIGKLVLSNQVPAAGRFLVIYVRSSKYYQGAIDGRF